MKKIYLLMLFATVSFLGFGQILTFDFDGLSGDEVSAVSNWNDVNITSSVITRGSGLTASGNANRFNATSWALTSIGDAVSGNDYMEFTITPQSGYQFSVSSILFNIQRSTTGPRGIALRSSVDGYESNIDQEYSVLDATSTQTFTFVFDQLNSTSPITYRIYMWAESTGGSGGIGDASGNDIIVSGTTSSVGAPNPEPENHATLFSATTNSSSQITLTWIDAIAGAQAPSGYLVKAAIDPDSPSAPVDGTAEVDGLLVKNIVSGIQTAVFTGLTPSTTYSFSIWPYTNSGTDIDYKTDGMIPGDNAITDFALQEPMPGDLVITEISGDGVGGTGSDDGFMEVYNNTSNALSLDNVSARYYNSNPGNATQTVTMSGSIASGAFIIITQNNANFTATYGFAADFSGSLFYFNGGDDGCDIYHSANGIIDQYNEVGSGSTPWNWDDDYSWERNSYNSGMLQASWEENEGSSPISFGLSVWLGAVSADWNSSSNWLFNNKSSNTTNTIIPLGLTNYPTITAITAETKSLILQNGAELTIAADGALTTNGVFVSTGGGIMTIQSNSSQNGSFIPSGVLGSANIERTITGHGGVDANGWHLISQPVTDATFNVAGSDFVPGGTDDLYWWNESLYLWENYKETAFDFAVGEGYLCSYANTSTKVFIGTPNASDVSVSGLSWTDNNEDDSYDGWNLLGNPFPSDIVWNNGDWTLTNVGGVAQVFNSANRNYQAVTANNNIASMQGFFVQVDASSTGAVNIPASARTHGNSAWLKKAESENTLELKVNGGNVPYYDQTLIRFRDDASIDYDAQIDGHKMFGLAETPALYTANGSESFSVNSLPFSNAEQLLPLNFKAGVDGEFTIEITENTLLSEGKTYLEDLLLNQMIDLSVQDNYTFLATTNDEANRFLLHFNGVTAVDDLQGAQAPLVYALDNYVYISSQENINAEIFVYNVNGQQIAHGQMNNEEVKRIALGASKGIYLVNIQSEHSVWTEKVFIK